MSLHQEKYPLFGNSADPLINLFFPMLKQFLWRGSNALFQCCALLPWDLMPVPETPGLIHTSVLISTRNSKSTDSKSPLSFPSSIMELFSGLPKYVFSLIKKSLSTELQSHVNLALWWNSQYEKPLLEMLQGAVLEWGEDGRWWWILLFFYKKNQFSFYSQDTCFR